MLDARGDAGSRKEIQALVESLDVFPGDGLDDELEPRRLLVSATADRAGNHDQQPPS
jgi:hypothetical protein